jgi:hypothetical protein
MYHLLENPEEADWQRETHRTESRLKSLVSKSNVTMHNIATLLDLDRDRENNGPMRKLLDALADVEASRAISTIDAVFQDVKGRGSQDLIVVQTNPAFKHILRLAKAGNEVAATWLTSYYLRYLQSRAINTSPANDAPAPRQEERSGTVHDAVALGWLRSILDHEGGELVHWREDLVAIVRSRDVPAELRGDLLDLLYRGFQDLGDLALMFREFGYGQKNGRPVFPDANDASLADIIAARIGRLTGEPDAVPWERRELKTAQLHHWFRCHRPSFMIIQALFEHHPSARMRRAAHDISKSFRGAWWRCFIYSLWRPYEDGWEIE